jgi:23S rRNA pseudouridine2605 synthase
VGRLDKETTGALLFANDGDLSTAILRPEHKLRKEYWLWLNEDIRAEDPRLLEWTRGMPFKEGLAKAESVDILCARDGMTELLVSLREGKNRQLRRMARQSDFRLLHLHRRQIGSLTLKEMSPGDIRPLSERELSQLWDDVGGKESVRRAQHNALCRRAATARDSGNPELRLEKFLNDYRGAQQQ